MYIHFFLNIKNEKVGQKRLWGDGIAFVDLKISVNKKVVTIKLRSLGLAFSLLLIRSVASQGYHGPGGTSYSGHSGCSQVLPSLSGCCSPALEVRTGMSLSPPAWVPE